MALRRSVLFRKIGFILIPVIGIPLLFFGKEYLCMYVIWVSGAYIGSNLIPIAIASLLPIFFFPVFHIVTAGEISMMYFRDVAVLFTVTMLMALAVEEAKLHSRIALALLKVSGSKRQYVLMSFMLATTFISFFLSDAAATALMIPIAVAIIQTLQSVEQDNINCEKGPDKSQLTNWDGFSKEDRGFGKALLLATSHCSGIGGSAILTGSPANLLLNDQMQFFYSNNSEISYTQWLSYAMPTLPFLLVFDFIVLVWTCMGKEHLLFFENPFRSKNTKTVQDERSIRMVEAIRISYDDLGPIKFGEGSLLFWFGILNLSWIFRSPGFMSGWADLLPEKGKYLSDSTIGVLIASLMFIWPKDPWNDEHLSPILTYEVMKQKFSWTILLFIGQASALAYGVKISGLGDLVSCQVQKIIGSGSPLLLQVFAYLFALVIRELFGVSTVLIGVFLSCSQNFGINPLYIGLPVTLVLSFGYMTRTNVMNMLLIETRLISIRDTMYSGFFMDLFSFLLVILNMNTYAFWALNLSHIPSSTHSKLNCSSHY